MPTLENILAQLRISKDNFMENESLLPSHKIRSKIEELRRLNYRNKPKPRKNVLLGYKRKFFLNSRINVDINYEKKFNAGCSLIQQQQKLFVLNSQYNHENDTCSNFTCCD